MKRLNNIQENETTKLKVCGPLSVCWVVNFICLFAICDSVYHVAINVQPHRFEKFKAKISARKMNNNKKKRPTPEKRRTIDVIYFCWMRFWCVSCTLFVLNFIWGDRIPRRHFSCAVFSLGFKFYYYSMTNFPVNFRFLFLSNHQNMSRWKESKKNRTDLNHKQTS